MLDILQKIVETTPGAKAAILMGFDGIAVEQCVEGGSDAIDIESMAMEFSFRFVELRNAAESLEMGEISDITIKAENGCLLVRCLTSEYFVAVLLENARNFGKGRWILRNSAHALAGQL